MSFIYDACNVNNEPVCKRIVFVFVFLFVCLFFGGGGFEDGGAHLKTFQFHISLIAKEVFNPHLIDSTYPM